MFNFDDGSFSQRDSMQMLASYGLKGVLWANPALVGQGGKLTWSDLTALHALGHEIGNHSLHHYDYTWWGGGSTYTVEQAQAEWEVAQQTLQQYGFDGPGCAAPYGDAQPKLTDQTAKYYGFCRNSGSYFGENHQLPHWPLRRPHTGGVPYDSISQDQVPDVQTVLKTIDVAIANGTTLWLTFHHVANSGITSSYVTWPYFETIVSYVASKQASGDVDVLTPSEWWTRNLAR
jgi:hypothetical protein